jgi:16S rRNA (adenine1518-N6/adenine1519-N6)-dimethyltransferase
MNRRIHPLRKFSQNFLTNRVYAEKIIEVLDLQPGDIVLEIGAGTGVLTDVIQRYPCARKVSLEIDKRCVQMLREKFTSGVEIVEKSILEYSFRDLCRQGAKNIKIVGNIPYHITSAILFRLLEEREYIDQAVLMVQKEVAERLLAQPHSKAYGIPTILLGYYSRMERLLELSRNNFLPVPSVDSTVIRIRFRKHPKDLKDHVLFRNVVQECFRTRRKMIQNGLKRILSTVLVEQIKSIPLSVRPEDLTVEEYIDLANEIHDLRNPVPGGTV